MSGIVEEVPFGSFVSRHIGPQADEINAMCKTLGSASLDDLIGKIVPTGIRSKDALKLNRFQTAASEAGALRRLKEISRKNKVCRSFIGQGYYDCLTPGVIQRNILENPGWYTQYTPYQPEISQGRLEALLNFQTMISDLTGLPVSNASLLDEGTAAAEGMALCFGIWEKNRSDAGKSGANPRFLIDSKCHAQTIAVVQTRALALDLEVVVADYDKFDIAENVFGLLVQYPNTEGRVLDYRALVTKAHAAGALVTVATDLLALTLLTPPGEWGADVAVGSAQRFGVPMGFGGPHAAFFAVKDEYKRLMPGRLIGVSIDAQGKHALRLSLQTREQHIRREKATSNICTAQALLASMASMYAAYHGPAGLKAIALRVAGQAAQLGAALVKIGHTVLHSEFFDTLWIKPKGNRAEIIERAKNRQINLLIGGEDCIGISLDEATIETELAALIEIFGGKASNLEISAEPKLPKSLLRSSAFLTHPVFNRYHSETEMLRYIKRLESKDLSLAIAMIPLGSCTMKLNATAEMFPVTWPEFGKIHPFAPADQVTGYAEMCTDLENALSDITGFPAVSLQPNSGSQGEYAGLLVIRAYHQSRGQGQRRICLIPKSAHGTNPASAVMAGLEVVVVNCDEQGNVDIADLKAKASEHSNNLAALMVTYPSTHGVFEESIKEIAQIIHSAGGQVYMDGANLNALVGLCRPADFGADVCHINLHKTFCIPHGGGGPGMGPIGVAAHLAPFLPNHPIVNLGHAKGVGPVSAAPWGSASILTISWVYCAMMAGNGLTQATKVAILNANYIAERLKNYFPVVFKGKSGFVAHECILDLRGAKREAGIEVDDVAKRLMDYSFHAPTVSWPVAGTMMVEPTESESKAELDRFCDALIAIHAEIQAVKSGKFDRTNNPLKNAPHTAEVVVSDEWNRPYSRELAAFPSPETRASKFWPAVGRVDSSYGDKNLVCTCQG